MYTLTAYVCDCSVNKEVYTLTVYVCDGSVNKVVYTLTVYVCDSRSKTVNKAEHTFRQCCVIT